MTHTHQGDVINRSQEGDKAACCYGCVKVLKVMFHGWYVTFGLRLALCTMLAIFERMASGGQQ